MKKSMAFYNFLTWMLSGIIKLLFRVKLVGAENENYDKTVIVCANHMSNWDPVILACVTKRPFRFMSKDELFKIPVLKQLLLAIGAFPIKRGSSDIAALKMTIEMLKNGTDVCLFAQGKRYIGVSPENTESKTGVSMLLNHTKTAVLPVGIYTKGYKIVPFKRVYVVIGKARSYESFAFVDNSKDEYQRVSNEIFADILGLVKKAENGEYDG